MRSIGFNLDTPVFSLILFVFSISFISFWALGLSWTRHFHRQQEQILLNKVKQLYRFAEFGRIASGLFHDLVNPLTSTELDLDLLKRDLLHQHHQAFLLRSVKSAQLNLRRIDEFVVAARQQIQKQVIQEEFSLNQELKYVLQILAYKARQQQIKLSVEQVSRVQLYGNPLKMNQVLTNVIANAIDAYQQVARPVRAEVHVRMMTTSHQVIIYVQDWGSGIKDNLKKQIFEPLFTTKPPTLGMGIGLALAKEVVEKDFAGSIDFISRENFGTTFTITIPRCRSKQ